MDSRKVIWLPRVKRKLGQFRSQRFSPEETFDFIATIIFETEELLTNPYLSGTYIEEIGRFEGVSRIVIRKFRLYFERYENDIVIVAVLFPGES